MKTNTPSGNFQLAKALAILIVSTAHFFPNTVLWVPSSISLFIFGFSSAYFTHLKYGETLALVPYSVNKFARLGVPLLIVNLFILVVCSITSSRSIWVWETPLHILGLSGILDWLHIQNRSPLGNGMWFFTVLLMFYLTYPLLRRIDRSTRHSFVMPLLAAAATTYCHFHYPVGYDLWLTVFSFVFGVHIAGRQPRLSTKMLGFGCVALGTMMVVINYILKDNSYNFLLIMLSSAFLAVWLISGTLPDWMHRLVRYSSDLVLEIYLIHTYLFVSPTGWKLVDYVLSMCIILGTAKILRVVVEHIEHMSGRMVVLKKTHASPRSA